MATLEKPKKMRRRFPAGSAAQPWGNGVAGAPLTPQANLPPCANRPLSLTLTLFAVRRRPVLWLNVTLARSTAGHPSPDPIVRPSILSVALAPTGGVVTLPFWSRKVTHRSTRELGIMIHSSTQTGTAPIDPVVTF